MVATLNANEPATPVSPPLAPDVDFAPKLCSALPPTVFIVAEAVRPSAVMCAPAPTEASLRMVATLMATATPTPVPLLVVVALPSPVALAFMLLEDWS
ncbi:hypothetical protein D9M68_186230 [compost metagenome]